MNTWSPRRGSLFPWRCEFRLANGLSLFVVAFLGVTLLLRVLTDDRSAPDSRHSGSLSLSGAIAVLFIGLASALLLRRRQGMLPTVLVVLWLCIWTTISTTNSGVSSETFREGVRELSVIAIAVIVYNARETVSASVATRLVQVVGFVPAVLSLYQLATHTGMEVAHNLRANGTFAHPNSAAMFFAIAAIASLWRYLDNGRHRLDALLVVLFAAALIATFSIDGLLTLAAMLIVFGALHPGPFRIKLIPWAIAGVVVVSFVATPLGAQRVASESSTSLAAAEHGETTSTLDTRLYRWKTLLPEWEGSPVFGRGLGTTTTTENTLANRYNGLLPHNEYIRYLVETGIVGVAILIGSVTILIRALVCRRKMPGPQSGSAFNAPSLAIAIVVGCLVNSLADNTLLNSPTGYAAALIIAAVLASPDSRMQTRPIPPIV